MPVLTALQRLQSKILATGLFKKMLASSRCKHFHLQKNTVRLWCAYFCSHTVCINLTVYMLIHLTI